MYSSSKGLQSLYITGVEWNLPKKICFGPSCNRLVSMKEKYCHSCTEIMDIEKREKNQKYDEYIRDDHTVKFYHSKEWKRVREAALVRDHFLCQKCLNDNIINSAEIVHHIIEVKEDWSKRLDIINCESVCKRCHNSLHAKMEHCI